MINIVSYITEKLRLNKDTQVLDDVLEFVIKYAGIDKKFKYFNDISQVIEHELDSCNMHSIDKIEIRCNNKGDYVLQHRKLKDEDEIDLNNIEFNSINWGFDLTRDDIIFDKTPFTMYQVNNGFIIRYGIGDTNYKLYFHK